MIYIYQHYEFSDYITLFFIMISIHFFFLTNHAYQFSDIQFNAGFIGVPFYSMILNGILILTNTFFFPCISIVTIASIIYKKNKNVSLEYTKNSLLIILFFIYQMVSIMLFTYFQSGHLEIFRIFTPKVCFDGITLLIIDFVVLIVTLIMKRVKNVEIVENDEKEKSD